MNFKSTKKVKKGMKVRATRDIVYTTNDFIQAGGVYTIASIVGNLVTTKEMPFLFSVVNFAPLTVRDKKGRFTSPKAKIKAKPVTFKPGSLYGVQRKQGRVIARLRSLAPVGKNTTYGVFTLHNGKPFLAKVDRVTLADKEEVNEYFRK